MLRPDGYSRCVFRGANDADMITRYCPKRQCPCLVENDQVEVELEAGLGFQLRTSPSPNLPARAWRETYSGLPQLLPLQIVMELRQYRSSSARGRRATR